VSYVGGCYVARLFLERRWPSGIPSARAFCLSELGVRLSALEMVLTRVLILEWCLSSFTSARVQSRRTTRFLLAILAISFLRFSSQALIAQISAYVCTDRRVSGESATEERVKLKNVQDDIKATGCRFRHETLKAQGYTQWRSIVLDNGTWEVDDAINAAGKQFDLRIDASTLKVTNSIPE